MHSYYILYSDKVKRTRWSSQSHSSSVPILLSICPVGKQTWLWVSFPLLLNKWNSRKSPIAGQLFRDSLARGGNRMFPCPIISYLIVVAWAGIRRKFLKSQLAKWFARSEAGKGDKKPKSRAAVCSFVQTCTSTEHWALTSTDGGQINKPPSTNRVVKRPVRRSVSDVLGCHIHKRAALNARLRVAIRMRSSDHLLVQGSATWRSSAVSSRTCPDIPRAMQVCEAKHDELGGNSESWIEPVISTSICWNHRVWVFSFFGNKGKIYVDSSLFFSQIIMTGICNHICIYIFIICLYLIFFKKGKK